MKWFGWCNPGIGRLWAWLLMAVLLAGDLAAEPAAMTLRVGYVEFPPFEYRDASGQPAGRFIELTRRVAEEAGYQLEFVYLPISRAYFSLVNGSIDLWPGLTLIPALNEAVVASRSRPLQVQLSAWSLKIHPPITQFSDLKGKTLILISGYTYGGLRDILAMDKDIRITDAPNHEAALHMLGRGRGTHLLNYTHPIEQLLETLPIASLRQSPLRVRQAAWLVSRQRDDAIAIRDALDAAYEALVARGEVAPPPASTGFRALPGYPLTDQPQD
ncbi:MAG: transporter substrate-binding domain-containing protein [Marinobacter sp.]|uniref:substrate-binding periplasmic protein n=1 Tax=Marinobacter sp. TaxID=50741 RepID=UPI00299CEA20|nr:transporter substrate-binding domain-containing protein [Marinobacter sp.]MDX1635903.1 transporter substrate-binding domain-containing protein [Marinobacter sp.]